MLSLIARLDLTEQRRGREAQLLTAFVDLAHLHDVRAQAVADEYAEQDGDSPGQLRPEKTVKPC